MSVSAKLPGSQKPFYNEKQWQQVAKFAIWMLKQFVRHFCVVL